MHKMAGEIQIEVSKLLIDLENLNDRFNKLDKYFELAQKTLGQVKVSQKKTYNRGKKIVSIEVDQNEKKSTNFIN